MPEETPPESFQHELNVALRAVRAAAQVCRSVQTAITPQVLEKHDRSPVTVADFGSQAVICGALKETFPQDPVMAEEESAALSRTENDTFLGRVVQELQRIGLRSSAAEICQWIDHGSADEFSQRFWTLDPIDGTKGFLRGEQYAISLALIVEGRIEVALLGCPNLPLSFSRSQALLGNAAPRSSASQGPKRSFATRAKGLHKPGRAEQFFTPFGTTAVA